MPMNTILLARIGGVSIRTNAQGMRGPWANKHKAPGVYRILLVGDQKAFGWGMPEEKTYAALLQGMLDAHFIGKFEVLNAGMPGYDLPQMQEYFETFGEIYAPDVVCVLVDSADILGDLDAEKIRERYLKAPLKYSCLARLLYRLIAYQPPPTPDPRIAKKARRALRQMEKTCLVDHIDLVVVFWSLSDDQLRPQAIGALPKTSALVHANVVDSAPMLTDVLPNTARQGLLGHSPSEYAHELLAQLHLAALTMRTPSFIFQRRDGQPVPRDMQPPSTK
ncbi:MAG TPA: hypothetical protein PK961_16945, partial [bacterium]|nr:hypothetical protein [bacterium]